MRFSYLMVLLLEIAAVSAPASGGSPQGIVVLEAQTQPRSQREAMLILPGFASKDEGVTDIQNYFSHKGFDLYIPEYIGRDSLAQCVANLDAFIRNEKLEDYEKLSIFAFILGGWTLNSWIQQHPHNNISAIVYDRSPLQERAAYAAVQDMPFLTRIWGGRIVEEFSKTPYSPIPNDEKWIGIILESRATDLVKKHKKTVLSLGEVSWAVGSLNQECDDYFYTLNNHDEMYHKLQDVGAEILYFLHHGSFTPKAPRVKPNVDPFGHEATPK
jgi:hypothetical protein